MFDMQVARNLCDSYSGVISKQGGWDKPCNIESNDNLMLSNVSVRL